MGLRSLNSSTAPYRDRFSRTGIDAARLYSFGASDAWILSDTTNSPSLFKISLDTLGNLYAMGNPTTGTNNYFYKINLNTLTVEWQSQYTFPNTSIAVSQNGQYVAIVGKNSSTVGPTTPVKAYISRINPSDGSIIWTKGAQYGASGSYGNDDILNDCAIDSSGYIHAVGSSVVESDTPRDEFLRMSLASDGSELVTPHGFANTFYRDYWISVKSNSYRLVMGGLTQTAPHLGFGNAAIASVPYNSTSYSWMKVIGNQLSDIIQNVEIDALNNCWALLKRPSTSNILLKFDSSGNTLYTKEILLSSASTGLTLGSSDKGNSLATDGTDLFFAFSIFESSNRRVIVGKISGESVSWVNVLENDTIDLDNACIVYDSENNKLLITCRLSGANNTPTFGIKVSADGSDAPKSYSSTSYGTFSYSSYSGFSLSTVTGITINNYTTNNTYAASLETLSNSQSPYSNATISEATELDNFFGSHLYYTTSGTFTWTAPADAATYGVNAVCIGGGGGGNYYQNNRNTGGGGGGLGWKNNIPVVAGQTYTIVVGSGGPGANGVSGTIGSPGNDSYFINSVTVKGGAGGGAGAVGSPALGGGVGGNYVGDGGGNGGSGGQVNTVSPVGTVVGGGGGAGGYSGNGGKGGVNINNPTENPSGAGTGGGGSGGIQYGGGGVGIYGEGPSGTAVSGNDGPGVGGSGGTDSPTSTREGGVYGGGAGYSAVGGGGAVRIMWGPNRQFPSTNT